MGAEPYEVVCSSDDHDTWLAARRTLVTASDIAGLVLPVQARPRWMKSPLELYQLKKGLLDAEDGSERLRFAHDMEEPIRRSYERVTGRKTRPARVLLRSTRYPFLGASLDAWVFLEGERMPLEIKTHTGDDWEEGIPSYGLPQLAAQEAVTGAAGSSTAVSLFGRPPLWADHQRNEELIERCVEAARELHRRLELDDPPPPEGTSGDYEALVAMYPSYEVGKAEMLPIESSEWLSRYYEIGDEEKRLKAEKQEIKNKVASLIGDAEVGLVPGNGGSFSWTTVKAHSYTVSKKESRRLNPRKPKK